MSDVEETSKRVKTEKGSWYSPRTLECLKWGVQVLWWKEVKELVAGKKMVIVSNTFHKRVKLEFYSVCVNVCCLFCIWCVWGGHFPLVCSFCLLCPISANTSYSLGKWNPSWKASLSFSCHSVWAQHNTGFLFTLWCWKSEVDSKNYPGVYCIKLSIKELFRKWEWFQTTHCGEDKWGLVWRILEPNVNTCCLFFPSCLFWGQAGAI